MLFLLSANTEANTILFTPGIDGELNGQLVNSAGTTIEVNPDEVISGTVFIRVESSHVTNPLTPVALTTTWGSTRAENVRKIVAHVDYNFGAPTYIELNISPDPFITPVIPNETTPQPQLAVTPALIAPHDPGLYYIIFANRAECNVNAIMSATNWRPAPAGTSNVCSDPQSTPVWNDGNDLGWDWTPDQFLQVQNNGQLSQDTYFPETATTLSSLYGANWIAIKVVPVPAAIWLFGSGLLGIIAVARRKEHS